MIKQFGNLSIQTPMLYFFRYTIHKIRKTNIIYPFVVSQSNRNAAAFKLFITDNNIPLLHRLRARKTLPRRHQYRMECFCLLKLVQSTVPPFSKRVHYQYIYFFYLLSCDRMLHIDRHCLIHNIGKENKSNSLPIRRWSFFEKICSSFILFNLY